MAGGLYLSRPHQLLPIPLTTVYYVPFSATYTAVFDTCVFSFRPTSVVVLAHRRRPSAGAFLAPVGGCNLCSPPPGPPPPVLLFTPLKMLRLSPLMLLYIAHVILHDLPGTWLCGLAATAAGAGTPACRGGGGRTGGQQTPARAARNDALCPPKPLPQCQPPQGSRGGEIPGFVLDPGRFLPPHFARRWQMARAPACLPLLHLALLSFSCQDG